LSWICGFLSQQRQEAKPKNGRYDGIAKGDKVVYEANHK